MVETSLSQVQDSPYEALSYVWGNKDSTEKIRVNSCPFTVTENLFEALSNLRQSWGDRLIWIDAICIDQSHHAVSKKSRYVEFVILLHCSLIVWLGNEVVKLYACFLS